MLATSDVIAFASTTDLGRARSFHESVLSLSIVDEKAYACVFDAKGTMLRTTAPDPVGSRGRASAIRRAHLLIALRQRVAAMCVFSVDLTQRGAS